MFTLSKSNRVRVIYSCKHDTAKENSLLS